MKKLAILIATLFVLMTFGASAGIVVKPDTIETLFQSNNYLETNWSVSRNRGDNGALTIDETADIDGHTYRVSIEGSDNGVYRVSLLGWYRDMKMLDDGQFSEGLVTYSNLLSTCLEFLPDEGPLYGAFNAYDIYYTVAEGSRYFEDEGFEGWELLATQPGRLAMRNGSSMIEAQRLDEGGFWFAVTF